MNGSKSSSSRRYVVMAAMAAACVLALTWWLLTERAGWSRGDALRVALASLMDPPRSDAALVAQVILDNYLETRVIAARWSGVYWGFTFVAAALSALAGLILKFESVVKDQAVKKDVAALFSVTAAILITVSTSGDFQRKWQANRVAAGELERIGYELLANKGADARRYLSTVARIMHQRNMDIVGSMDGRKSGEASGAGAAAP